MTSELEARVPSVSRMVGNGADDVPRNVSIASIASFAFACCPEWEGLFCGSLDVGFVSESRLVG